MWHGSHRFPSGSWGFALLLLRLSAACAAALIFPVDPGVSSTLHALCLLFAAGLLVGIATPLCAIGSILLLLGCGVAHWSIWHALAWGGVLVALALLGGGAWSLDARLFGKRVIRING